MKSSLGPLVAGFLALAVTACNLSSPDAAGQGSPGPGEAAASYADSLESFALGGYMIVEREGVPRLEGDSLFVMSATAAAARASTQRLSTSKPARPPTKWGCTMRAAPYARCLGAKSRRTRCPTRCATRSPFTSLCPTDGGSFSGQETA